MQFRAILLRKKLSSHQLKYHLYNIQDQSIVIFPLRKKLNSPQLKKHPKKMMLFDKTNHLSSIIINHYNFIFLRALYLSVAYLIFFYLSYNILFLFSSSLNSTFSLILLDLSTSMPASLKISTSLILGRYDLIHLLSIKLTVCIIPWVPPPPN